MIASRPWQLWKSRAPAVALAWLGLSTAPATAQVVDTTLWVTNGNVRTAILSGSTLYLGGEFSVVGPSTGGGVPLSATTGSILPPFPKVLGNGWLGRAAVLVNRGLIRLSRSLFSYQIYVEAESTPDVSFVLRDTQRRSAARVSNGVEEHNGNRHWA